ncbi:hypothetical protein [Achromobacter aegrifaciens]
MHVAIKQTVLDKILERIHQIRRQDREPEYIAVTPEEYSELRADRRQWRYVAPDIPACTAAQYRPTVANVTLSTREFTLRDCHRGRAGAHPFIRTYSREKFMDLPLYVVPTEYMPA